MKLITKSAHAFRHIEASEGAFPPPDRIGKMLFYLSFTGPQGAVSVEALAEPDGFTSEGIARALRSLADRVEKEFG